MELNNICIYVVFLQLHHTLLVLQHSLILLWHSLLPVQLESPATSRMLAAGTALHSSGYGSRRSWRPWDYGQGPDRYAI